MKVFFTLLLFSCSGYKLKKRVNPFAKYSIRSIAVPMFHNETALAGLSKYFTQFFTQELYKIKSLEVVNNTLKAKKPDAFLVGIISGAKEYHNALRRELSIQANRLAPNNAQSNTNIVPITNEVKLKLDVYVLRDLKSIENLKLLKKASELNSVDLNNSLMQKKGIISHKILNLSIDNIAREINDNKDFVVNATQNYRLIDKVLEKKAKEIARNFTHRYLYEF